MTALWGAIARVADCASRAVTWCGLALVGLATSLRALAGHAYRKAHR